MSSGHCCTYFCFVTFGVYVDKEKKNWELRTDEMKELESLWEFKRAIKQ